MKTIENEFNKIILIEMIYSVLYGLFGLFIFLKSEITNKTVGLFVGTFFLIYGFILIFSFLNKNKISIFHFNFVLGILSIILGIFIMFNPLSILNILNISLGIGLFIEGINKTITFLYLRKIDKRSSMVFFASCLLFLFLGVIIILNPFRTIVITKTIGIFIILYNLLNLNDLVLLKRKGQKFLKYFKKSQE